MLYIWWDWKGVLYYELLLENQTINSNQYCSQLDQLKAALYKKHPELVNRKCVIPSGYRKTSCFFDDQAKTVTAWLGSSDPSAIFTRYCAFRFPLFRSSQNSLNGKNFHSLEDCKRHLELFFSQKDKKFWEDGVMKLPEK